MKGMKKKFASKKHKIEQNVRKFYSETKTIENKNTNMNKNIITKY